MSTLVLPNGAPLQKAVATTNTPVGKGEIVGLSPWKGTRVHPWNLQDAVVKHSQWDEYFAMYEAHPYVRSAIDKIAKSATNVGFDIVPRDSRSDPNQQEVDQIKGFFTQQEDFGHEIMKAYQHMLIGGDAFIYIVPDRLRRPVRLRTLHPKTVHIQINKQGQVLGYVQKNLDEIGNDNDPVFFEPQEIIHIKINNPNDDIYGLSPLESLKWSVGTDFYAQRYNASFFANSGVTGTIIGVRNADPNEIQRNRKWLEENYMGPEAAHKPIILEGESISISKSVATHQEMGFLAGRTFIIQEILAVLDVPPAKLGIMESANRSNSKEQDKSFRTEALAPLQNIMENAINGQFVYPILGIKETKIVHAEGDTRDQIEQMEYFTEGERYGIFSPNEIRAKLGMAPVEGGDNNFVMTPTGAVPLDRMNLYFALPQPNTDKVPAVEEDPPEGEPQQTRSNQTKVTSAISRDMKKSTVAGATENLRAALAVLKDASSKAHLAVAYSYLEDATIIGEDVERAAVTLHKALTSDDPYLTEGYIGRVMNSLQNYYHLEDNDAREL